MWVALPDELLLRIAKLAPLEALVVLRNLEFRCARIAQGRLHFARRLVRSPFNLTRKQIFEDAKIDLFACNCSEWDMEEFSDAVASGALASCTFLDLSLNTVKDRGIVALSKALAEGAMPQLKTLGLAYNEIYDRGMTSFADFLSMGALARCEHIDLSGNKISDDGVIALSRSLSKGALASCQILSLDKNRIGDKGLHALSGALATRAMPKCRTLSLNDNPTRKAFLVEDVVKNRK